MSRSNFKVSLIGPLGEGDQSVTRTKLMTIYRVNSRFSLPAIIRLVSKIRPDIIHVHAPNFFSCQAIPVAKIIGLPIVATVHLGEVDPIDNPLYFFRKHALARFNKIIAVSNFTKDLALNAGVDSSKLSVVYNSCDETFFYSGKNKVALRNQNNLPANSKIIIFVGDLIKRKGVSYLIEALVILRKQFQEFMAIIVGNGEERQSLESLVDKYDMRRHVIFSGNISREKLADFYGAADVFVLPSSAEGHSVALVEAMASGLPLVASNIESSRISINNGVNGFLFETGDSSELAEKLKIILTDDKLQNVMSSNSSKMYRDRFSTQALIQNHTRIYHSLTRKENSY
jgi:glycosyltransferase involved in cell wall biosynthesis